MNFTPTAQATASGTLTITSNAYLPSDITLVGTGAGSSSGTGVTVSISPTSATVQGDQSQQFVAIVSGSTNTAVYWSVNSVKGGNSIVGTISSTGLYSAPECPSSSTVTVTAQSAYASSASANSAVTLAAGAGSAGNYYVATNGSDSNDGSACSPWATVVHADSVVGPGATVHVAPGTYNQADFSTNTSGTASARIRYISDTKWAAQIVTNGWVNYGNYVDIVGFDVSGSSIANYGILIYGSYVRVIGNRAHDIPAGGCTSEGGAGIYLDYGVSNNDAIGNVVFNVGDITQDCWRVHGIYAAGAGGYILNNIVFHNTGWGIHQWHAATKQIIANNTVFSNGYGGIVIGDGETTVSSDYNIVSNNIGFSWFVSSTGLLAKREKLWLVSARNFLGSFCRPLWLPGHLDCPLQHGRSRSRAGALVHHGTDIGCRADNC